MALFLGGVTICLQAGADTFIGRVACEAIAGGKRVVDALANVFRGKGKE